MRFIVVFLSFLLMMFAYNFGISILLHPEWLTRPGWVLELTAILFTRSSGLIGESIIALALTILVENKIVKEWVEYVIGDKYKNISNRLDEFTQQEINKEIKSRKYIPNIFVETTEIKEKLRYFSEPFLFFPKIVEQTDRELKGSYIINALKIVHYPVIEPGYPKLGLNNVDQTSLRDGVQKYKKYLDEKLKQTDVLKKENGMGIKPEYISNIPGEFLHIHDYMRPNLQYYSLYEWAIRDSKKDLDLLISKFVIVKSAAGHGKTNLLCDFTDNFLKRKKQKSLYISARSFNHLGEQETIEQTIARTVFTDAEYQFADILRLVKFDKRIDFLFILIDGINEHRNLPLFSTAIEQFIQKCSGHNIKIILTCRSEYFEDRFGNLLHLENSSVLDMDERRYVNEIPDVHIEALLSRYFSEFKIKLSVENVDPDIMKVLNKDKLLLRIFCEAYENEHPSDYLGDLYKLEIFHKYYEKKIKVIDGLENCLKEIVLRMIADNQFANIQISSLSTGSIKVIENTVYENVIIKKDMLANPGLAFGKSEVINFVYDEFRDFLIASEVINEWGLNNQSSIDMIQNLATPRSPVAEGLQRYLCLWSIKNKKNDLLDYLSSQEWFDKIFIISVFETPDSSLSDYVIDRIRGLFVANSTNALRIIWHLIRRANEANYPNLNIESMFKWIDKFDDADYERIVIGALSKEYDYESAHVTQICQMIVDAFREKRVLKVSRKNIIKFTAYIVGVEDYGYLRVRYSKLGKYPASEALDIVTEEVGEKHVQEALSEVIASSNAELIKTALSSLLRRIGEE
jgi:hypothetical protein